MDTINYSFIAEVGDKINKTGFNNKYYIGVVYKGNKRGF